MTAFHADLEPAERRDVADAADRWWQDAVGRVHDLVRRHGRAAVLAATGDPSEDGADAARTRKDEGFDAVRIAVWADLALLQARAAREVEAVRARLPAERKRSTDPLQPSLLFVPAE